MALLGISVAVFVLSFLSNDLGNTIGRFAAQFNPNVASGEVYRLVTAAFLHGGITHLGFNMYALYLFGPTLEREVGSAPFAAMYFASAVAGGAAFYLLEPQGLAVGASGAIFGLFGAWIAASYRGRSTRRLGSPACVTC